MNPGRVASEAGQPSAAAALSDLGSLRLDWPLAVMLIAVVALPAAAAGPVARPAAAELVVEPVAERSVDYVGAVVAAAVAELRLVAPVLSVLVPVAFEGAVLAIFEPAVAGGVEEG